MEFQDRFFDTGEIQLHYLEGPKNGPPLVLIHGATGGSNEWSPLRDWLAKDWHVFCLTQRGHGLSGRAGSVAEYNASRNIGDTLALLREVVGAPAVVWGHSWGAIVTLLSAGAAKELLRGVVLEDPPVMIRRAICPEMKPYMDYFGMVLRLKQSVNSLEEIKTALRQMNPEIPEVALEGWATNVYQVDANFIRLVLAGPEIVAGIDFAQAIREVSVPVLLMQADPAMGAALAEEDLAFVLENNPGFELVKFAGAGHGIHVEQAEKVLAAFEKFVEKV